VGGEADLVDEQVGGVAVPVGGLRVVASSGVQVVGQAVGDVVAVAQEPVEDVEEFGDVGELGGVDRCGGLLAVVRNLLGGLCIRLPGEAVVVA
jgi:hypothetical protein